MFFKKLNIMMSWGKKTGCLCLIYLPNMVYHWLNLLRKQDQFNRTKFKCRFWVLPLGVTAASHPCASHPLPSLFSSHLLCLLLWTFKTSQREIRSYTRVLPLKKFQMPMTSQNKVIRFKTIPVHIALMMS